MQRTYFDRAARQAVAALASGKGKMLASNLVEADYSGKCENPHYSQIRGVKSPVHGERHIASDEVGATSIEVDSIVPCRKCGWCLRQRSNKWAARAAAEIHAAPRSWFGTLTLSPDEHARAFSLAVVRSRKRWGDFDGLSPEDQLSMRDQIITPAIQRMFKRIRKNTAASLRYLVVCEAHKNGLPHYHILLHVADGECKLAHIENEWHHGFSKWRLVQDARPASYLAKYLSKSLVVRVRASQGYGLIQRPTDKVFSPKENVNPPTTPQGSLLALQQEPMREY